MGWLVHFLEAEVEELQRDELNMIKYVLPKLHSTLQKGRVRAVIHRPSVESGIAINDLNFFF